MGKIRELLDAVDFKKSDDYKKGWRGAVCHINNFYKIERRSDGEPIDIVISLEVSEDCIVEKLKKLLKE